MNTSVVGIVVDGVTSIVVVLGGDDVGATVECIDAVDFGSAFVVCTCDCVNVVDDVGVGVVAVVVYVCDCVPADVRCVVVPRQHHHQ